MRERAGDVDCVVGACGEDMIEEKKRFRGRLKFDSTYILRQLVKRVEPAARKEEVDC